MKNLHRKQTCCIKSNYKAESINQSRQISNCRVLSNARHNIIFVQMITFANMKLFPVCVRNSWAVRFAASMPASHLFLSLRMEDSSDLKSHNITKPTLTAIFHISLRCNHLDEQWKRRPYDKIIRTVSFCSHTGKQHKTSNGRLRPKINFPRLGSVPLFPSVFWSCSLASRKGIWYVKRLCHLSPVVPFGTHEGRGLTGNQRGLGSHKNQLLHGNVGSMAKLQKLLLQKYTQKLHNMDSYYILIPPSTPPKIASCTGSFQHYCWHVSQTVLLQLADKSEWVSASICMARSR